MAKTAQRRTARAGGRPPSGPAGERVSTYPPLTVRIPPATKRRLLALAQLTSTPAWKLVDAALLAYFDTRPAAERRLLAEFAKHQNA